MNTALLEPASRRRNSKATRVRSNHNGVLEQLASRLGIQTSYQDMEGRRHPASRETLQALLQLWDVDASNERNLAQALQEEGLRHWRQCVEPVYALWQGKPMKIEVRLPAGAERRCACTLTLEEGTLKRLDRALQGTRAGKRVRLGETSFEARQLKLPRMPPGYHQLSLELNGRIHRALLIVAPERSYSPPAPSRSWGVFLPMYAAHSDNSWGGGNLRDWARLSRWVTKLGGRFVSTLPLLPAFLGETMCEPSPYSPASRLFWNEYYLDVFSLPEFQTNQRAQRVVGTAEFQARARELRSLESIDYRAEAALRRQVVAILARDFFKQKASPARRDFEKFLTERPAAADYAIFRATSESLGSWHNWESRLKHGKLQEEDYHQAARNYHLYAQWRAERQFSSFIKDLEKRDSLFYLDMPLGVHPDGYDIWRERSYFAFPASAGAPPDMFFTRGQDWGFAPLHPRRIRELGYRYVLDYLRFMMRHTGLLRIDHVMGLHRLYWVPRGFPPTEGAYVTYPAEELHAILSLESHRHGTVLVGENLGTVPRRVNEAMERHHLRQTFVVQYEQQPNPARAVRDAPVRSVASANTHDMPTFAAHWNGLDLEDRAELGLVRRTEIAGELGKRKKLNAALVAFLRKKGFLMENEPDAASAVRACLRWLAAGPAEIVQVNLEDLWKETQPQNVPGTSTERPNWRRKTKLTVEEIEGSEELAGFLRELTRLRQR